MADSRQEGLDLIFWKKQVPSAEQIVAIEAKGIGLSPKDRGAVADDTKAGIDAFQKATDQEAFIATFPPELHEALRRIAPKKKGGIVTPPPPKDTTRTSSPAGEGGHMADNKPEGGDKPQGADDKAKKTAAVRVAEEATKKAEAEARKAADDRVAAVARQATAEAEARKAADDRVAAEIAQREADKKAADKIMDGADKRRAAPTPPMVPSPTSSPSAPPPPPPPPPAAVQPAPPAGVTIRLDSTKLGWLVAIIVVFFFSVYLFWGDNEKTVVATVPAVPIAVDDPEIKATKDLMAAEVEIRESCVRLKYADRKDAPRCDQMVERYKKMKGIDE